MKREDIPMIAPETSLQVVNLFGGPGAGKSTAASGLFHEMKRHWIEAEYVTEYAKELVWSDASYLLSQQNLIFAEQQSRINRLCGKADVAITDAPLLMSSFYAPSAYPQSFHQYVFDVFELYKNINIVVRRSHKYALTGRLQNQAGADRIAEEIESFLRLNGIPFWVITAADSAPLRLLRWLTDQGIVACPDDLPEVMQKSWAHALDGVEDNWIELVPATRPWQSGDPIRRPSLAGVDMLHPVDPADGFIEQE